MKLEDSIYGINGEFKLKYIKGKKFKFNLKEFISTYIRCLALIMVITVIPNLINKVEIAVTYLMAGIFIGALIITVIVLKFRRRWKEIG
ncbi:hypothetical protein [Anaerocolumna aminovalerica]|uniref:hypothetical protein n=1 Tax=Anaerocolumna aminovalerica TaxID=1527 RepID=UPI00248B7DAF|nr:hypothetical protein [Anaerocolumna aminovalerica]